MEKTFDNSKRTKNQPDDKIRFDSTLTESGILFESGEIVTDGLIVELAREAERLWLAKDDDNFIKMFTSENSKFESLSDDDQRKLLLTKISKGGHIASNLFYLDDAAENK